MIKNMMKPRSQRVIVSEQVGSGGGGSGGGTSRGAKLAAGETLSANGVVGAAAQQASAAAARKRRSSINVYDQPSSLNSRLRQLETDMLRLDEDRTKLFDDTHTALAQYELKLGEIHAILKSRQDNVEKYVEDMRTLLAAKEEFEKQTKLLNEKHDRIHEKFMHRETIISREIKLLKNKFEVLEKNRQFRGMLQKSNLAGAGASGDNMTTSDDLASNLDGSADIRTRSEAGTSLSGVLEGSTLDGGGGASGGRLASVLAGRGGGGGAGAGGKKNVRIKLSNLGALGSLLEPLFRIKSSKRRSRVARRRKSNRVASITATGDNLGAVAPAPVDELASVVGDKSTGEVGSVGHPDGPDTASALPLLAARSESIGPELSPDGGDAEIPSAEQTADKRKSSFLGRLFTRRGKT